MTEFNRGIWDKCSEIFPAEYRVQVFYKHMKYKKATELQAFMVIDDVRVRTDVEVSWDHLNETEGDYNQGHRVVKIIKDTLDQEIRDGAIERIRNEQ